MKQLFIGNILSNSIGALAFLNKCSIQHYVNPIPKNKRKDNAHVGCAFSYFSCFHTAETHQLAYDGKHREGKGGGGTQLPAEKYQRGLEPHIVPRFRSPSMASKHPGSNTFSVAKYTEPYAESLSR